MMSCWRSRLSGALIAGLWLTIVEPGHAQNFSSAVRFGVVETLEISEASGLVASRQSPGVLWTHNDYGATLHAIATNGVLLGSYTLPSVFSGDFEDLAIGPGPAPEYQYLY